MPAGAQSIPGLTPEQQAMLDSLPAAQRSEVMRQYQQFQQTQRRADPDRNGTRDADPRARRTTDPRLDRLEEEQERDPTVIRPGDTLLIEVRRPIVDEETGERDPGRRDHLLRGRHTVELDRFGRLTMPGLTNIALAGLNDEQAAMRLMAEPALSGMSVFVTRLTLRATGRDALEPFGYHIFRRPLEAFQPRGSELVPSDYVVGPGDTVQIQLFGREFGSYNLTVTRDGTLHIPNIGPVSVAGSRYEEMRANLEQRIQEQTIGTRASVTMGELRSIEVFILGDVARPGSYTVSSLATVLHALYASGGIAQIGSLRDIRLLRGGEVVRNLDLYELLLHGNATDDVRLRAGDVVFVPATGPRAGVMGEALRPAWYEIQDGTTVGTLLDYAGGGSSDADLTRIRLQRVTTDGRPRVLDIDGTSADGRATPVQRGDLVSVPRVTRTAENAIELAGHFTLTGDREWRDGLRVRDLIPDRAALRDNADLDYALVVRELADGRGVQVHMFSPREMLSDEASPDNLRLHPRDRILTFGFDDATGRRALVDPLVERLRRQATSDTGAQVVRVSGAVRAPGTYPLASGMRIGDLVSAGGGLGESAFVEGAELSRYRVTDELEREIHHTEVPLGAALAGIASANIALHPNDVLNVRTLPQWADRGNIQLRGEVRFPGTYPIRPGETVSSIIERAGGLTDEAYPAAAVFTRETLREREQEQMDQMIRRLEADIATAGTRQMEGDAAQAQAMARSLVEQLRRTRAAGRLVVNLPRLLDEPGSRDADILAHDGDTLVIPRRPQEVTVMGEVYFPTSHIYDPQLGRDGYLQRSGGVTYRGDARRMYVVRANGAVEPIGQGRWGRGRAQQIQAGDTIIVPVDAERVPTMVRVMNVSQILYQLGVAAAAWNTIGVF